MSDLDPLDKIILVHGFIRDNIDNFLDYTGKMKRSINETTIPLTDLVVSSENIEIFAELPGVKLEDFNVVMYDGYIIIEGYKRDDKPDKKGTFHRMERTFTPFRRIVKLPYEVEEKNITANLKDGVLIIKIKRKETEEK
jgi:HSP20 family protein